MFDYSNPIRVHPSPRFAPGRTRAPACTRAGARQLRAVVKREQLDQRFGAALTRLPIRLPNGTFLKWRSATTLQKRLSRFTEPFSKRNG
jgi:hypothetical protein